VKNEENYYSSSRNQSLCPYEPRDYFPHFGLSLWYIFLMFQIAKQAAGKRGAYVKLVKLDSDDYTVIVRSAEDGRLHHRYLGPDLAKAEEVFSAEAGKLET